MTVIILLSSLTGLQQPRKTSVCLYHSTNIVQIRSSGDETGLHGPNSNEFDSSAASERQTLEVVQKYCDKGLL